MSDTNNNDDKIELEGHQLSLADLAGFDMSGVEAKKFENLPEGHFQFEITADPAPGLKVIANKGAAVLPCKVLNIVALKNPAETADPTKLIGKFHYETALINTQESLSYLMTTLEALQCKRGPLGGVPGKPGMLDSLAGVRFSAGIKHRRDKNDPDKIYAGLIRIDNVVLPSASSIAG